MMSSPQVPTIAHSRDRVVTFTYGLMQPVKVTSTEWAKTPGTHWDTTSTEWAKTPGTHWDTTSTERFLALAA